MLRNTLARLGRKARALYRDEQGADMVEYLLIVVVLALPIAAILIYYRKEIADWVKSLWEGVKSDQGNQGA
jgi:Flp pilus assembly pilin Flp